MMHKYFITGIDTNVGKTIVSAIMVKALEAYYWKPIQSGDLEHSDSMKVQALSGADSERILPETFRFTTPASPHLAAEIENVKIELNQFQLPIQTPLIVEGAGGLMVPLNDKYLMIDLIKKLDIPVVLVSKNYLGSINHTLLSILMLHKYNIPIKGIIMNGDKHEPSERAIQSIGNVSIIHHIPIVEKLDRAFVEAQARLIRDKLG